MPAQPDETLDAPAYEPPKPRRSRLAVASVFLALLSIPAFFALFVATFAVARPVLLVAPGLGIAAVVLGGAALNAIGKSGGRIAGRKMAMTGIIAGSLLAILAGVIGVASRDFLEFAWSEVCYGRLREVGLACHSYSDDNDGAFPSDPGVLCPKYLHPGNFSCCKSPSRWEEIPKTGTITAQSSSYVYVSGLRASDPAGCVLAFGRQANHFERKRHVLFVDAHIDSLADSELAERMAKTREAVKKRGGEIRLVGE